MSRPEWLQRLATVRPAIDLSTDEEVFVWQPNASQMAALVAAADIVLALAAANPVSIGDCVLCDVDLENGRAPHADECPWKRSRSWIENYGQ